MRAFSNSAFEDLQRQSDVDTCSCQRTMPAAADAPEARGQSVDNQFTGRVARADSARFRAFNTPTASQAGYSRNPRQDVCTGRHAAWSRPASARRCGLIPAVPKPVVDMDEEPLNPQRLVEVGAIRSQPTKVQSERSPVSNKRKRPRLDVALCSQLESAAPVVGT